MNAGRGKASTEGESKMPRNEMGRPMDRQSKRLRRSRRAREPKACPSRSAWPAVGQQHGHGRKQHEVDAGQPQRLLAEKQEHDEPAHGQTVICRNAELMANNPRSPRSAVSNLPAPTRRRQQENLRHRQARQPKVVGAKRGVPDRQQVHDGVTHHGHRGHQPPRRAVARQPQFSQRYPPPSESGQQQKRLSKTCRPSP